MEKVLAMFVAAQLTQAAMSGSGGAATPDPELKDPATRARNLMTWEIFRVFYRAVVGALALFTKVSRVALFWIAFILTRPFGATMGDVLARDADEGGLGWGTLYPSLALLAVCLVVIVLTARRDRRRQPDIRRRAGLCPWCGYDRKGVAADLPCPECGRALGSAGE